MGDPNRVSVSSCFRVASLTSSDTVTLDKYLSLSRTILLSFRSCVVKIQSCPMVNTHTDTDNKYKWIRNYSAYSDPITLHALGGLAGSRRTLLQRRAAGGRHGHLRLQSVTSNRNPMRIAWRTILLNFIPISFETTKPWAFFEEVARTRTIRRTIRRVAMVQNYF